MDTVIALDRLADYFETMSAASVALMGDYYADDAAFKDPFNEVRGLPAIRRIFSHMYRQVSAPRFIVTARMAGADGAAMLVWEFHFRARFGLREEAHLIRGSPRLLGRGRGTVRQAAAARQPDAGAGQEAGRLKQAVSVPWLVGFGGQSQHRAGNRLAPDQVVMHFGHARRIAGRHA
jgi:steroid delta-isomerase